MDNNKRNMLIRVAAVCVLLILLTVGELFLNQLKQDIGGAEDSGNGSQVQVVEQTKTDESQEDHSENSIEINNGLTEQLVDSDETEDDSKYQVHSDDAIQNQEESAFKQKDSLNGDSSQVNLDQEDSVTNLNDDNIQSEHVENSYTFRKQSLFEQHFEKHGAEMGYSTKEEYLAGANRVINNPDSLHKTEAEDGDDIYYLESTNEIVFVSQDGYIRTYFSPSRGIDYYNKQ